MEVMFEKFGEFDSAEEINTAALEQLRAGNKEAVFQIAEENGLDREDAEDFMNGDLEKLTTTESAEFGKIKIKLQKEFEKCETIKALGNTLSCINKTIDSIFLTALTDLLEKQEYCKMPKVEINGKIFIDKLVDYVLNECDSFADEYNYDKEWFKTRFREEFNKNKLN